jgi:hypothetical protein
MRNLPRHQIDIDVKWEALGWIVNRTATVRERHLKRKQKAGAEPAEALRRLKEEQCLSL